jgi:nitroreductase
MDSPAASPILMNMEPGMCSGAITSMHHDNDDMAAFLDARDLIESRHNTSPKRLLEPGPGEEQILAVLSLAAAAPDHGGITPWRFVIVPREARAALGHVFALDLIDRDAGATLQQIEDAREKAHRAPLLIVAIARLGSSERDIPPLERMISMGAAVQNILLGAHAMGFGAGLTSGRAMASRRLRELLALADGEQAVCCINIGTATHPTRPKRARPSPATFLTYWVPPVDASHGRAPEGAAYLQD